MLDRRQMSASEGETCLRMRVSARGSGVAPVSITLTVGHGCAGASLPRPCRTRPLAAAAAAAVRAAAAFFLLLSLSPARIAAVPTVAASSQLPNYCTQRLLSPVEYISTLASRGFVSVFQVSGELLKLLLPPFIFLVVAAGSSVICFLKLKTPVVREGSGGSIFYI